MSTLPAARQSPRIENGILYFYMGDTFELDLELTLTDQDGEDISIAAASTVKVEFLNRQNQTVKSFEFTDIQNNTVTLCFDAVCSALFSRGEYRYRIYYTAQQRTTLAADDICIVE